MLFHIEGRITLIPAILNFETILQYNLTVTVSDSGGLTEVKYVTVDIINVNEAPLIQNLPDTLTITEDVVGDVSIVTINTVDQDGDLITYSISGNPYSGPFEINSAGKIYNDLFIILCKSESMIVNFI